MALRRKATPTFGPEDSDDNCEVVAATPASHPSAQAPSSVETAATPATPLTPLTLTPEILAQIAAVTASMMQQMQTPAPPPTPAIPAAIAQIAQNQEASRGLPWSSVPKFSTEKPGEIDRWFCQFENVVRGANIRESSWLQRWHQCSQVEASDKEAACQESSISDYGTLRRYFLSKYGPRYPTEYFRQEMHDLTADSAQEAKKELNRLLNLHNRAAKDNELPAMRPWQLVYYFLNAVPTGMRSALQQKLPDARDKPCPYEYLADCASAVKPASRLLVMADKEQESDEPEGTPKDGHNLFVRGKQSRKQREFQRAMRGQPRHDHAEERLLALLEERFRRPAGPQPPAKRLRGSCPHCGGGCASREVCPARNGKCNSCGKPGHWAKVCRTQRRPMHNMGQNPNEVPMRDGPRPFH